MRLTDYFHGYWEDSNWGRLPATEVLLGLAVHELNFKIGDAASRAEIQSAAAKVVAKNAGGMVKR